MWDPIDNTVSLSAALLFESTTWGPGLWLKKLSLTLATCNTRAFVASGLTNDANDMQMTYMLTSDGLATNAYFPGWSSYPCSRKRAVSLAARLVF